MNQVGGCAFIHVTVLLPERDSMLEEDRKGPGERRGKETRSGPSKYLSGSLKLNNTVGLVEGGRRKLYISL
jgi:hypothetical protein